MSFGIYNLILLAPFQSARKLWKLAYKNHLSSAHPQTVTKFIV